MKFRKILVIEPPKDYSALRQYTQNIEFMITGKEPLKELPAIIHESLLAFDPSQDALVAYGNSNTILLVGMALKSLFPYSTIKIGIYRVRMVDTKQYEWVGVK